MHLAWPLGSPGLKALPDQESHHAAIDVLCSRDSGAGVVR
jgi:hypothetical protein